MPDCQTVKFTAYFAGVVVGFLGAAIILGIQWIISKASEEDDL